MRIIFIKHNIEIRTFPTFFFQKTYSVAQLYHFERPKVAPKWGQMVVQNGCSERGRGVGPGLGIVDTFSLLLILRNLVRGSGLKVS